MVEQVFGILVSNLPFLTEGREMADATRQEKMRVFIVEL